MSLNNPWLETNLPTKNTCDNSLGREELTNRIEKIHDSFCVNKISKTNFHKKNQLS